MSSEGDPTTQGNFTRINVNKIINKDTSTSTSNVHINETVKVDSEKLWFQDTESPPLNRKYHYLKNVNGSLVFGTDASTSGVMDSADVITILENNNYPDGFDLKASSLNISGNTQFSGINYKWSASNSIAHGSSLIYNSNGVLSWSNLSAGTLVSLTDVTISSPIDYQLLRYSSGKWINSSSIDSVIIGKNVPMAANFTDINASDITLTNLTATTVTANSLNIDGTISLTSGTEIIGDNPLETTLLIKSATSQSNDILRLTNNDESSVYMRMYSNGNTLVENLTVEDKLNVNAGLTIIGDTANETTFEVRGASGQTANVFVLSNNSGETKLTFDGTDLQMYGNGKMIFKNSQSYIYSPQASYLNIVSGCDLTIESTGTTSESIYIHTNGGTNETIKIHADQGTSASSVNIVSDVGGITLSSPTAGSSQGVKVSGQFILDVETKEYGEISELAGGGRRTTLSLVAPVSFIDVSDSGSNDVSYYLNLSPSNVPSGTIKHLFTSLNTSKTSQNIDLTFTADSSSNANGVSGDLISGTGNAKKLIFDNDGQSASLIYVGSAWRIINTGASVL